MSIEECEMILLRNAVQEAENKNTMQITPEVRKMVKLLEDFLRKKKLICYGGIAINNILPLNSQFYDFTKEIPDYDFYSKTPLDDAKELADVYHENDFDDIEAKAGKHSGTFKVFVGVIGIADITFLEPEIFDNLAKEVVVKNGICYASPKFLRMNLYLELSRPKGMVNRWEKILSRLNLLNKFYPFQIQTRIQSRNAVSQNALLDRFIFAFLIKHDVVFFGGYAFNWYAKEPQFASQSSQFDLLTEAYQELPQKLMDYLKAKGFECTSEEKSAIGEILPEHTVILYKTAIICRMYKPIACYSYNEIIVDYTHIRLASMQTMIMFFFAFQFANDVEEYDKERILSMAEVLFNIEQTNRVEKNGLLKRFNVDCYGNQQSLYDILKKKKELKKQKFKTKEEKDWHFLFYRPSDETTHDAGIFEPIMSMFRSKTSPSVGADDEEEEEKEGEPADEPTDNPADEPAKEKTPVMNFREKLLKKKQQTESNNLIDF
jgi:hypothetical protein